MFQVLTQQSNEKTFPQHHISCLSYIFSSKKVKF